MWYAAVETTKQFTENKALTLIGTHACPKLLFVTENKNEGNAGTSQKMCQGGKVCKACSDYRCANVCILDIGKHERSTWALFEERSLSGSVKPQT
jgi:CO dehydrogenase/acetyl-CoA synthase alpha subunit